ncbi:signal transduction histidine kinase [Leucobacter luti]|uniref:sensor histidine kinase n=1 Tax=Leucobacter luti TaxID=340320 RepID=UPI0010438034|nr:sensor histidine kinase [Leucobacter luti]MCW2289012.1 signal transduction histidine kinase [Leucobacter luti]TCK44840.1 signal transduction histidine kinase [Leucobacter luti]
MTQKGTRQFAVGKNLFRGCVVAVLLLEVAFAAVETSSWLIASAMSLGLVTMLFIWRAPMIPLLANFVVALFDGPIPLSILVAYYVIIRSGPLSRKILLPTAVVFVAHLRPWEPNYFNDAYWVLSLIVALAATGLTMTVGNLVYTRRNLATALDSLEVAHRQARIAEAREAVAAERARISREMHDVVSHQVSLIAVQAGALQTGSSDPSVIEVAKGIRGLSVETLAELRYLLSALSADPPPTNGASQYPGLNQIPDLVEKSGVDATLRLAVGSDLQLPVQRAMYRVIQEGLTNVQKHAPGAKAHVLLVAEGEYFKLILENERPPSAPANSLPGSGKGLIGARERFELLGGELHYGPTVDGGYMVTATVPITRL